MKKPIQILSAVILIFVITGNIFAQSEEKPVLVVSFQKVKLSDIQTVNKMINRKFAPILNALVDEKMIGGWGLFNHAWGDEWNVNIVHNTLHIYPMSDLLLAQPRHCCNT